MLEIGPDLSRKAPVFGITVAASAMMLTRNASLVFLPGIALVVAWRLRDEARLTRGAIAGAVIAVPLVAWQLVRIGLAMPSGHPFQLGGKWSLPGYLAQVVEGLARLLGAGGRQHEPPWSTLFGVAPPDGGFGWLCLLGLLGLLGWTLRPSEGVDDAARTDALQVLVTTGSGLAGLVVVFNFTWVADPLLGRFLWFMAITLPVCAAARIASQRERVGLRVGIAILALAAGLQIWRFAMISRHFTPNVGPAYALTPELVGGEAFERDGLHYVSPPRYLPREQARRSLDPIPR